MKFQSLYQWFFPYSCVLCGKVSDQKQDLCKACHAELPESEQGCVYCAIPIPTQGICGHCLKEKPPFDHTHALFLYEKPITTLILELKFKQALVNARVLGELLAEKIHHHWYLNRPLPDVILPIPLHRDRLKERGFNQALEIARPIAKLLKRPLETHAAIRTKATPAQATLSGEQRKKNMQSAFQIHADFSRQHVAVIDDVITTGSTVHEFCTVLKQKGARIIDVWCSARAQWKKW